MRNRPRPREELYAGIADALAGEGWTAVPGFVDSRLLATLAAECFALWSDGAFRRAGTGIGETWQIRPEVRSDCVLWLDPAGLSAAQRRYFELLEQLRRRINQTLFLGLFEFEGHFTVYPPGAFYKKHLDRFRGARHRLVSCILYLNEDWRREDGGALRLYTDERDESATVDIHPEGGTLVAFLSERC
ncbi:MAG: 2OG-Fe(II) oxygenase, partial [Arenicellales bacterium]